MKVLHVLSGLTGGGAELAMARMVARMKSDKNLQSDVVNVVLCLGPVGLADSLLRESGIEIHYLNAGGGAGFLLRLGVLRKILRTVQPDVIQGWMYQGSLAASIASALCGRARPPVIWSIRQTLPPAPRGSLRERAVLGACRLLSRTPAALVYNSHAGALQAAQIGFNTARAVVIPNGFDTESFHPLSTEARESARRGLFERAFSSQIPPRFLVGAAGRSHPMKDHETFVRAAALVAAQIPDTGFLLIGRGLGSPHHPLRTLVQTLRLDSRFVFIDEQVDMERQLAMVDVMVSSSAHSEGFPNVIAEAMACGVPCVGTMVGDTAAIIEDTGLTVPPRNPQALADGIIEILGLAPEARAALGVRARSRILHNFSLNENIRRHLELYHLLRTKNLENNLDARTVSGFGDEWAAFPQSQVEEGDAEAMFRSFFAVFPWDKIGKDAVGFDLGCGSGRWARRVAPRVGRLHCIEPSAKALTTARDLLKDQPNCVFYNEGVGNMPLPPASMDFGYALGVLHHVPDTLAGLRACTACLKPGAPFLLYLYYKLETRPFWFRTLWHGSNLLRAGVSRLPHAVKLVVSGFFALTAYWPLARFAWLVETLGGKTEGLPLSWYRDRSFYVMRVDSYDRFCTRLEKRFTKEQTAEMMRAAGLRDLEFSTELPYWCAVGYKV